MEQKNDIDMKTQTVFVVVSLIARMYTEGPFKEQLHVFNMCETVTSHNDLIIKIKQFTDLILQNGYDEIVHVVATSLPMKELLYDSD